MPRRPSRRRHLKAAPPVASARVLDPTTQITYVLLRADIYDRSKALFEEELFPLEEAYLLQDEIARREGWDDPAMAAYDMPDSRSSA